VITLKLKLCSRTALACGIHIYSVCRLQAPCPGIRCRWP